MEEKSVASLMSEAIEKLPEDERRIVTEREAMSIVLQRQYEERRSKSVKFLVGQQW